MKLPLLREPRMRQMKKTISEAEEEIKHLKTILSKTNRTPLSTPETSPTSSIGSTSSTDYSPSRATSAGSRSITRTPCTRYPGHANQEVVSEMYSPTTAALALGKQLDITPRPHRVNALLPFTTTISCIKSARTTIKKALFDPARNLNINRKMLSTRFRKNPSKKVSLSTDYIFYQKKGENMRKAIAKSQKMLVGEFLRRSENSNELPDRHHAKHLQEVLP